MQQAFGGECVRASLVLMLLGTAAGAVAGEPSSQRVPGILQTFGPAAVALPDGAAGGAGNPALLLLLQRPEMQFEAGYDGSVPAFARASASWPGTMAWAATFEQQRAAHPEPGSELRQRLARLAQARPLGRALALGGALVLQSQRLGETDGASFGADLGLHLWPARLRRAAVAPGEAPHFGAGVLVRNAWPRRRALEGTTRDAARRVEAGVAYEDDVARDWRMAALIGFGAARGEASVPALGVRAAWRRCIDLAAGWEPQALRFAAGARAGSLRCELAVAREDGEMQQTVALRMGFGATLEARRAARERELEDELARRLGLEIEARQERQIRTWLEDAQQARARRDHARAAELFRNVLTWRPEDPVARHGLRRAQFEMYVQQADSLSAQQDARGAAVLLEQALVLCPGDSVAASRLQQMQASQRAVQRTRDAAAEQFRLGLEAYAAQRWSDASRCFTNVLQLDPGDRSARAYMERSRAAAESQLQSALGEARARLERRDLDGARAQLQPVLENDPLQPEANRILALIGREQERLAQEQRLAELRRQTDARHAEDTAREDRSPPAVSRLEVAAGYERGMQLYRGGDLVGAMQSWEEVARSAPHYQEVDQYLLRVYRVCGLESYTEGRLQKAIEIWDKALRLEPGNQQVRRYLNQAHAKLKRAQSGERAR